MANNNFVAGPGVTGASDYQTSASALDRKQRMIEALMSQQTPQGRMLGQVYVGPTGLQSILGAMTPVMGQALQGKVDEARASNAQKYQAGLQQAMQDLNKPGASGSIPREQILQMLTSQYPELRARGGTEMGKLDAMDTPFMRMMGGQIQGGGQPQGIGAPGGAQTFPVGDTPPTPNGPAPSGLSGVQPPSGGPVNPGLAAVMKQFPNLTPEEVQQLLASDPSGKLLVEASTKRNSPIVAGNNVFQPQGGGRIGNAPGSLDAMTAVLRAQEAAKAPYGTPIRIETEGGEQVMRPDQFVEATGGVGGAAPGAGFQLPAVGNASNMVVPPQVQQARDGDRLSILRGELAKATNPADIAALNREIAGTQGAPAPRPSGPGVNSGYGPTQRAERTGLFDADVKQVSEFRASAQKAGQAMRAINQIESGLKGGTFSGAYADVQERAAALFKPLGIPVDVNKLTNTQEVKAFVQNLVIPQVKQLGFNPTDADARRIEEAVGNIRNDPKALEKIMGVLKADSRQTIDQFKRADAHLRKNRSLEGFDYGFENPTPTAPAPAAPAAPGTMTLQEYYEKMKGGR